MYQIKLVLSGGGINGIIHLGALSQLISEGFQPVSITGTSAGAIVSAIFTSQLRMSQGNFENALTKLFKLLNYDLTKFKDTSHFDLLIGFLRRDIRKVGLFKGKKAHKFLLEYTNELTFNDLTYCECIITATELYSGRLVVFSKKTTPDVKLADAARASMGMQFAFKPFKIRVDYLKNAIFEANIYDNKLLMKSPSVLADKDGNIYLIDGGNLGNCRTDIAHYYHCIGMPVVGVSLTYDNVPRYSLSPVTLAFHTVEIMMNAMEEIIQYNIDSEVMLRSKYRIDTLNFDLTIDEKRTLVDKGRMLVKLNRELIKQKCIKGQT